MCRLLLESGGARLLESGGNLLLEQCPPDVATGNWDTSDPRFYDWWRKRAKEERQKLEAIKAAPLRTAKPAPPTLREETIEAIEIATSVAEIQSLDMRKHERDILKAAIAEYQRMINDEEAAILLLLH